MNSLLWQVVIIMLGYKTIHLYKIYKEYEVVISVGN